MTGALGSAPSASDAELAELRGRIAADLEGEKTFLGRLRALKTIQRTALVIGMMIVVTVLTVATTPRHDLAAYPMGRMAAALLVLAFVSGAASWRLLRPLYAPPPNVWVSRSLLIMGVLTPVVLALMPLDHAGGAAGEGAAFAAACGKCLGFGGILGLPVLVLAFLVRRAHVDGAAIAALAGVAAGLTGNLTLQVHCPITEPTHLLLGHALLLAVLGVGAALWKR
jgi:hypothetical protein